MPSPSTSLITTNSAEKISAHSFRLAHLPRIKGLRINNHLVYKLSPARVSALAERFLERGFSFRSVNSVDCELLFPLERLDGGLGFGAEMSVRSVLRQFFSGFQESVLELLYLFALSSATNDSTWESHLREQCGPSVLPGDTVDYEALLLLESFNLGARVGSVITVGLDAEFL